MISLWPKILKSICPTAGCVVLIAFNSVRWQILITNSNQAPHFVSHHTTCVKFLGSMMKRIIFSSCRQFSIVCIAARKSVPVCYISEDLRQTYLQGSLSLRYTKYYKAVPLINDRNERLGDESWKANKSPGSNEISHSLCHSKFHYRVHNSLPRVLILTQTNPVYVLPLCLRPIYS
jgi:hypothetical protein